MRWFPMLAVGMLVGCEDPEVTEYTLHSASGPSCDSRFDAGAVLTIADYEDQEDVVELGGISMTCFSDGGWRSCGSADIDEIWSLDVTGNALYLSVEAWEPETDTLRSLCTADGSHTVTDLEQTGEDVGDVVATVLLMALLPFI